MSTFGLRTRATPVQKIMYARKKTQTTFLYGDVTDLSKLRGPLRKHAYSNILKTLQPKKGKFPIKNSDIFHISAQNIDCGYSLEPPWRGGSNEYPQSIF